ncbi:MAG: hypothetical protein JOY72_02410 [Actinobacteria bacterium]|nr:hypothetical protein [Actinomycetota bacterium]MBV8479135.1 hypothetical protein [Actinomycetota bacterium]
MRFAAALRLAGRRFAVVRFAAVLRFAVERLAVVRFAAVFRFAVDFRFVAVFRLAVERFAVLLRLAVDFRLVAVFRLAVVRFAVDFRLVAVLRFAVVRFAVVRLAVLRLAVVRFAAGRRFAVDRFAAVRFVPVLFLVAIWLLLVSEFGGNDSAQYAPTIGRFHHLQPKILRKLEMFSPTHSRLQTHFPRVCGGSFVTTCVQSPSRPCVRRTSSVPSIHLVRSCSDAFRSPTTCRRDSTNRANWRCARPAPSTFLFPSASRTASRS